MTRIERQTAEAVIDLLAAVGFLVGNGKAASGLRAHRLALSATLAADPAPAACDPYATVAPAGNICSAYVDLWPPATAYIEQYDAEAPE